ncbi:MAG: hypothetical protein IT558_00325 [Alphaproteobacteria bacterium]|nr:hypothetical protein [Alphaproteobacteria bacterium]
MVDPATIIFSAVSAIKNAFDIADKMDEQIKATNDQELVKNALALHKALYQIEKEQRRLEMRINELMQENEALRASNLPERNSSNKIIVDTNELEILKFLYAQPERANITLNVICQRCSLDEQKAKYHLKKLDDMHFIHIFISMSLSGAAPPTTYSIKHNGRAYLIENNLV